MGERIYQNERTLCAGTDIIIGYSKSILYKLD